MLSADLFSVVGMVSWLPRGRRHRCPWTIEDTFHLKLCLLSWSWMMIWSVCVSRYVGVYVGGKAPTGLKLGRSSHVVFDWLWARFLDGTSVFDVRYDWWPYLYILCAEWTRVVIVFVWNSGNSERYVISSLRREFLGRCIIFIIEQWLWYIQCRRQQVCPCYICMGWLLWNWKSMIQQKKQMKSREGSTMDRPSRHQESLPVNSRRQGLRWWWIRHRWCLSRVLCEWWAKHLRVVWSSRVPLAWKEDMWFRLGNKGKLMPAIHGSFHSAIC